jgi:glycosyltransferase involved in cell wall biosynthesis
MSHSPHTPTVSALVAAYNSEQWIEETVSAILAQTHPPDEVIVVDDGSTDRTADVLAGFGDAIRVIRRENGGCPAAFNTAFGAARGDYLAMCGADDLWDPRKLERQLETLRAHPEIDVSIGGAEIFGTLEDSFPEPGRGILDPQALAQTIFPFNIVCASSVLFRRELAERLGPFVERTDATEFAAWMRELGVGDVWDCEAPGVYNERFSADDYDYWMRALRAGAVFHYDPRVLVRYRRHDDNVTNDTTWGSRCCNLVHRWHGDMIEDRRLVRTVLATDLFSLGRRFVDAGRPREARVAFRASLRQRPGLRALLWSGLVSLPERPRRTLIGPLVSLKRSLDTVAVAARSAR